MTDDIADLRFYLSCCSPNHTRDDASATLDRLAARLDKLEEAEQTWTHETLLAIQREREAMAARLQEAERERDKWIQLAKTLDDAVTARDKKLKAAELRVAALQDVMRRLLADDDLPYPPDGDTCFCSMCKLVREARALLAGDGAE